MSRIYKRGPAQMEANLTPMIDVTFLLIVFFVLVSQIVEVENVDLELPELRDPATQMPGEEKRIVINVIPGASGDARGYRIGTTDLPPGPPGVQQLTQRLADLLTDSPTVRINLRADQNTHYEAVQPVLEAVATAAGRTGRDDLMPRVNLVIVPEGTR
jgi:biopolymer transport protein ExbD